ncbi:chitinase-3-like protein 1 [Condylostylus longicornis]|uniref:chitinase-3-like protein 1 n=1 Tax=Condylostylus longicornis TaxID=2530218 RepID=UPI00244DDF85|nr:chitinase-3-like protein 1 [Condylostylus longicornis]
MLLSVWILLLLIFNNYQIINAANDDDKLIFCMYLTRSAERQADGNFQVEYIDERYCTHLIYAYMGIDDNGVIKSLNPILDFEEKSGRGNIRKFNNKKHYNVNLKTLVAVGGWDPTESSRRYSLIFLDEANQDRFVKSTIDFIVKHNFNGLALHWTYPGLNGGDVNRDKHNLTSLLRKLKEEFSKKNLLLVAICQGLTSQIDDSYNVKDVSQNVDYIYLTSYDLYGEWSKHIGIASGLYLHPNEEDKGLSVDSVVTNWINRGAEPKRIIMGIPLFGRTFTLKYENQTEPGAFHVGPGRKSQHLQYAGIMSYMELCQVLDKEGWTIKWEDTQKNPYAFKDDQWIGFENTRSLEIKSRYVIDRKLAGIAAVFVEDDDFRGFCGEKYARLKLLNGYLRSGRESSFEYILNVSVFKKNLKDQYTQCVYHLSQPLDIS